MDAFIDSLSRILAAPHRGRRQYVIAKPSVVSKNDLYRRAIQATVCQFNAAAQTVLDEKKQGQSTGS